MAGLRSIFRLSSHVTAVPEMLASYRARSQKLPDSGRGARSQSLVAASVFRVLTVGGTRRSAAAHREANLTQAATKGIFASMSYARALPSTMVSSMASARARSSSVSTPMVSRGASAT